MDSLDGKNCNPTEWLEESVMDVREFDFVSSPLALGLSVIEASAGTGKTYAISHLVPRLLLDKSVSKLDEILLVTFTNDAARELSDRVRRVLETLHAAPAIDEVINNPGVSELRKTFKDAEHREIIARALLDVDRLGVSTIHSFCQRVIQNEGELCNLPVVPELVPNADDLIEDALYELWKTHIAGDGFLAAIASDNEWNAFDDLKFIKQMMDLDHPRTMPDARCFETAVREVDTLCSGFTAEMMAELEEIFDASVKNSTAVSMAELHELFSDLLQRRSGFFTAIICLAKSEKWIDGRKSKSQKARWSESRALALSKEILAAIPELNWQWKIFCFDQIQGIVAGQLRKKRLITYDGLISTVRDALALPGQGELLAARLRDHYRIALIDESQDTDPRQFEIFKRIFLNSEKTHRLVLIGDPKQAIYGFRGADVNTYLDAKSHALDSTFVLNKTYRSPQPLVNAVNAVFSRERSFLKEGLDYIPAVSGLTRDRCLSGQGVRESARLEFWIVPDANGDAYSSREKYTQRISESVASEIVRLLNTPARIVTGGESRFVGPGDFAVLVNDRFEAAAMIDALRQRQVPAIQAKAGDVMLSEEAGELLVLLRALNEPRRSGLRKAALATRLLQCSDSGLKHLSPDDDEQLDKFLRWQEVMHKHGIATLLAEVDREEKVTLGFAKLQDGERRITNLRQLTDLLQSMSLKLGNRPGQLLHWFGQQISCASTRTEVEEYQQHLESDAQAVQIVTMHAAKGLEYNLVFCPFLGATKFKKNTKSVCKLSEPGRLPLLVNTDLSTNPEYHKKLVRAAFEDRLRLAYVAITRAKVRVWIYAGACTGKDGTGSILDWLLWPEISVEFDDWYTLETSERGRRHMQAVAAFPDDITYREPPGPDDAVWNPQEVTETRALTTLPLPAIPAVWGITSFSSLTREKHPHAEIGTSIRPENTLALPDALIAANPFLYAPGGTRMGTAIHDWIEQWDFSSLDEPKLGAHLRKYNLPKMANGASLPDAVSAMLHELSNAILPELDCCVAKACRDVSASEWHFHLPIKKFLNPQMLASAFYNFGTGATRDYAMQLDALTVDQLQGYLQGFLDRLAIQGDTWGVIDWKTNQLGLMPEDYSESALMECAKQSHYLLQAHLYLVALRRYLGSEARIAGAWLVFLRGVQSGTSRGILSVCPTGDLLDALDDLFFHPQRGYR